MVEHTSVLYERIALLCVFIRSHIQDCKSIESPALQVLGSVVSQYRATYVFNGWKTARYSLL